MSGFFIKCLSTRLKFDIDVFCVVQRSFLWYPARIRANAELVNKGSMLELYVKVTDVALESAIQCRDIQRVGCGMGWERSTLRITGRDIAQTERILM